MSAAGVPAHGSYASPVWRRCWHWLVLGLDETDQASTGVRRTAPTDVRLAAAASEFERFVHAHERAILNYLWRMTGDEQAAYDLAQEVFLRAWQRFDTIRTYEQPRAWLFRVATNLALSYLRRNRSHSDGAAALVEERGPAVSDPAWRLAESDAVRRTLLRLSPGRRAALVLRELYGLSSAEVGQALGMSAATVRTTLHRAREQFRAIYLNEEGGHERD